MELDATRDGLIARCWAAEERLLQPEVRRDATAVEALLADEFAEIGQSGHRWTRAEVVAALADDPGSVEPEIDERTARIVAPDLVLLSYRLRFDGRTSRRTALWRCDPLPRCVFHQGTPLPDASAR